MKHALRKYIAPCGSALFMVVSTMAALVVLVTAMYMSVVSSGQVQYAKFDQEQAYVSSTSIADILGNYIADSKNSSKDLVKKVLALEPGHTISTDGNGFASLAGTGIDDTPLGGYSVDVTRLKDETIGSTTWHIFDVAVTVSQNDIVETTHTYLRTKDPEPTQMDPIDRFFTATGYVPNDVWVDSGTYNSTMYFDSEYVKFGNVVDGNGALTINSGIICAGTLEFQMDSANPAKCSEPTLWAIGNNLIIKSQPDSYDLGGNGPVATSEERGIIIVGGNLNIQHIANFGGTNAPTDVYVLGDVNITREVNFYGNLYVGGNINIDLPTDGQTQVKFHGGKIYSNAEKEIKVTANPSSSTGQTLLQYNGTYVTMDEIEATRWSVDETSPKFMLSQSDALKRLDAAIGGSVYPKWVVDTKEADKNVKNIVFNNRWGTLDVTDIKVVEDDGTTTPVSSYYSLGTTSVAPKMVEVIDSDCTIGDIVDVGDGTSGGMRPTIIFDTGAAGNTLTINLSNNIDLNPDDTDNTPIGFAWSAARTINGFIEPHSSDRLSGSGETLNVLTVGDGNLVINVPKGTTYQAAGQEFFGHYAWFMYMGGSKNTVTNNGVTYETYTNGTLSAGAPAKLKDVIHDADKCTTGTCTYIKAKNANKEDGYTCTTHGGFVKSDSAPTTCQCTGRIEKSKFTGDKYMYEGRPQEPNVNIFIVSCDESADIQIGCLKYPLNGKKGVEENVYYGYVYAPYMTYMDKSAGAGGGLKSCGGLIVSDYIMAGYYEYVYAKPDQSIEEIVGDKFETLTPNASREWRVHGT